MSLNKNSGFPHCPPGLEHVDTTANLKALSKLGFVQSATDNRSNISPSTTKIGEFLHGKRVELQHIDASSIALPNSKASGTKSDGARGESIFVTLSVKHESIYFLPHGLLEDDEDEEIALIQRLDLKASIALRRSCDAPRCLRARRRHSDGPESGAIYFHKSSFEGVLLTDIKSLKSGSLLGPEEDVMGSWGMPGSPTWMRIMINQHGYVKTTIHLPTKCYCANITRAGLALEIAFLLERYFAVQHL
ncbi:hypothetical protein C0992_009922 [Termitomyces sp. T32_za158]|nr:hypothetical protein C0992_009922 [Termitomyces sp. T32_za158]